jgi:N-acyl-D-amino-acid deacylase
VITRRQFVAAGAAASASVAMAGPSSVLAAPAVHARRRDVDLLIRGGQLLDGLGTEARALDVAITAGRVSAIGARLSDAAREEIDARGLVVAPGFVDIHSHADGSLYDDPRAESVIRQGITTIVCGADGSSRAVGSPARPFGPYLESLDRLRPACNVAAMVGLGSVRGAVVGNDDRPATADELRTMVSLVERSLAEGACGASTGLEYTPGAFASRDELIALCRPLRARGLAYATHMRNEDDRLLDAIDESIAVAEGAGCRLQVSHLKTQGPRNWDKLDQVFTRLEGAKARGLDVAFDRYPYLAYATGLTSLFPVWSRDGGTAAFFARLDDAAVRPRIRDETLAKIALIGGWDNVQITSVKAVTDRPAEGKRLGQYASTLGIDPFEVAVTLLRSNDGDVGMVGFAMSEPNLERILAHPLGMVCTDGGGFAIDGPTRRGSPHPRGIGSFPRVLGRYVRERRALTLADAVAKMSARPAARAALADRGVLAVGRPADVVVFDAATVDDIATFAQPFQYPTGIRAVLVNGMIALRDGERAREGSGRVLRPG